MMENSGVSKFTRLLPLSIRKDSSFSSSTTSPAGGNNLFGGQNLGGGDHQRHQTFDPFDPISSHSPPQLTPRNGTEQREMVRVTVTYPSPTVGAMNPHREISLRITNDENPTFFYHLRITEADYPVIKSQQGLLVDFFGFPNQLITLLEKCDPNQSSDSDEGGGGPRFIIVLKIGMSSVLDIVESNPFKYLCHLSLQINPGTDSEIKKYLADVTGGLKKECSLWQEKYSHLSTTMEGELNRLKSLLEQKNDELTKLREDIHNQASLLSNKHFQDMTVEKEKLLKMQGDLASKFENERQEIERRHSQTTAALETRISSLEQENRDLIQTKFKNETTLQAYSGRVKNLEDDLKLLQKEITLARKQNEKLDGDYHEKQRLVNSFQNRISVLEADLKEKTGTLQRQQDYIQQISEQKKFLEDNASKLVQEVEKIKSVNKNVSGELIKANEIIKKLQDDIRSLHTKCKMQCQITLEQERRIGDQEKQIQQLDQNLSDQKTSLQKLEESEVAAKEELSKSLEKIETLENTIKSNENMISWLNKQLNEFQGLGNLNKFRQNLQSAAAAGQVPSVSAALQQQLRARSAQDYSDPLGGSNIAMNGSQGRGLFSSSLNNQQNTLPNGTPSWMNIYQSTSTPLDQDNDLSSRFERISASNNNYSLGRSRLGHDKDRLDTISERTADTHFTNADANDQNADSENRNPKKTVTNTKTKPPTWARPRSGKVTLEVSAPSKANPVWRNN